MLKTFPTPNALCAWTLLLATGCGSASHLPWKKKAPSAPEAATTSTDAGTSQSAADAVVSCAVEKTPTQFVTTLAQDLFRRGPNAAELAKANDGAYTPDSFVDFALAQPESSTGVAYFVSNLLRLEQNLAIDAGSKDTADAALLADLKQEPVLLIQGNRKTPWPKLFTTTDFFCSARTAPLYSFPVDPNISGFVGCKMPPERAGILGLASVLRAFSSAYYTNNNNRHRVALALYLGQGLQLAAKTDGPTGAGRPAPLAACVPEIDTRISKTGAVFGTAAVPKVGPVCAGCHVPYLAPMEPAFLRFGLKGELLNLTDVKNFPDNVIEGISRDTLSEILQYGNQSCWAPDGGNEPPEEYTGLPGLGRLLGSSKKLANALAVQIQQNLVNQPADSAASAAIVNSYTAKGETLDAALRGFFLSPSYQCAQRKGG